MFENNYPLLAAAFETEMREARRFWAQRGCVKVDVHRHPGDERRDDVKVTTTRPRASSDVLIVGIPRKGTMYIDLSLLHNAVKGAHEVPAWGLTPILDHLTRVGLTYPDDWEEDFVMPVRIDGFVPEEQWA